MGLLEFVLHCHSVFTSAPIVQPLPLSATVAALPSGGVYTVVPVTNKGILSLAFHINRLYESAKIINLIDPAGRREDLELCVDLSLQACSTALKDAVVQDGKVEGKLALCIGPNSFKSGKSTEQLQVLSSFFPGSIMQPSNEQSLHFDHDITADFVIHRRRPASAKYTAWLIERQGIRRNLGVNESIMVHTTRDDRRLVTEGFTSNIVVLTRQGVLITTPAFLREEQDHNHVVPLLLEGGMLKQVKCLAQRLNIPWEERPLYLDECEKGDWVGAFLTSAGRGLLPIDRIILPHKNNKEEILRFSYKKDGAVDTLARHTYEMLYCSSFKDCDDAKNTWGSVNDILQLSDCSSDSQSLRKRLLDAIDEHRQSKLME